MLVLAEKGNSMLRTVNRYALVVRPLSPYFFWANSFDDSGPKLDPANAGDCCRVFLVPEIDDPDEVRVYLATMSKHIFREMLESWMKKPETWPDLDAKTFKEWFDVELLSPVFDLDDDDIISEED